MNLTNKDIFEARAPLQTLVGLKFPVATSFKLARMANKLNEPLKVIEEVRSRLIKQYGEPVENGQIAVSPECSNFPRFLAEFNDLMDMEVEIVIEKVKLPEEVDGKPLEIEPNILMALEKFVEV